MDNTLSSIRDDVNKFYIDNNVCKSHDIDHIDRCLHMLNLALDKENITEEIKFILRAAVILHDVDDEKLCTTDNYNNARGILNKYNISNVVEDIIECISYVSSSKNGDNIPTKCLDKEYLLYPRFVDRLDALDTHGVIRCYQFTITKGNPLFLPETLMSDDVFLLLQKKDTKIIRVTVLV